ncbi:hypothetical protein Scep_015517 [Stephania cephalantha]|uniref:V-SNARE coiled-coil homology domain-containing protein n=1 Tax=Stephania cephalantha TaxID=152367 RepID=A0AAP0P3Z6_9MAGN
MFAKRFLQKVAQHSSSSSSSSSSVNHGVATQMDLDPRTVIHYGIPSTSSMIAFDPIQQLLAVGTLDGRIKVIGGGNAESLLISPKPLPYKNLEFLCNEGFLMAISNENEIQVWDLEHRQIATSLQWEFNITSFSVVCGTFFMYVGDEYGSFSVLRYLPAKEKLLQLPYHIPVNCLIGAADVSVYTCQSIVGVLPQPGTCGNRQDKILLIAYDNGLIILWDASEAQVILVRAYKYLQVKDGGTNEFISEEKKEISSLCWAASDGSILAVGYVDGDLLLWDMTSDSSNKDKQAVKLELSSGTKRLPVIVLYWSANSRLPVGNGGQLFMYGGDEIGCEEVITVLNLECSGFETFRCFSRVNLKLNGPFADMMLIPSVDATGVNSSSTLLVLTNPGQLFVYDNITLSVLSSQQESKCSIPAVKFPLEAPISDSSMTVAKLILVPAGTNSCLSQIASVMKIDVKTAMGTKWSLASTVPSRSTFGEVDEVECVYMTGYKDGSVRMWDATCPAPSLMFVLEGKVENIQVAGVSASVSALDFCSLTMCFAIGNECGLVRIYKLSGSADETKFHFVTDTKTEVHIIHQGIGPQCTAVFSVLKSPIQTLQFINSGSKLAVGFECGHVAMLDMESFSVLFLTDCISGSSSPVISLIHKTLTNIHNLIDNPNQQESTDAGVHADVLLILTKHTRVAVVDSVTESSTLASELSMRKTPEQLNQSSATQHQPVQTIERRENTSDDELQSSSENIFSDESFQSLILLCCEDALSLFYLKSVIQVLLGLFLGHSNSILDVKLGKPCCWTTTFRKRDEKDCRLVLFYQTGVVEIRSLPDLEVKRDISLTSILRWNFKANMDRTTCSSDNGLISLVNGFELAFIDLLASENECSVFGSMPCLHDKVLAATIDDAILLSYHQKKRQANSSGLLNGLIKGFKGVKTASGKESTEVLSKSDFAMHLESMFSNVPFSEPFEIVSENEEITELNIDDIEIDEPANSLSTSPYDAKNDSKDNDTDREKLFESASVDTRPRSRTIEEIKAKYRKTGDASAVASQARDKLLERQEKLERLTMRTAEMQSGAENFESMANELVKRMEAKKWWQF